jgi:hypothetical protein
MTHSQSVKRLAWTGASVFLVGALMGLAYQSSRLLTAGAKTDEPNQGPVGTSGTDDAPVKDPGPGELVPAVGDNGVLGYIYMDDLKGGPSTPEEALAESQETTVLPVYAADGVTVVDHLTESGGEPTYVTPGPDSEGS